MTLRLTPNLRYERTIKESNNGTKKSRPVIRG